MHFSAGEDEHNMHEIISARRARFWHLYSVFLALNKVMNKKQLFVYELSALRIALAMKAFMKLADASQGTWS